MEQFNTIPTSGNWSDIAGILDANFLRCYTALVQSESLVGLDGSNYKGMYTSASALPDDMNEAGWALVGSSLSALQLYVFNDGATDWALFSNDTYNFTSWTEFQTQLDALSTQVATIGLKVDQLETKIDQFSTVEFKDALLACFRNVAWANSNGHQYYDALASALSDSTLVSLTATFSQGSNVIYDTYMLEKLKPYLTVTGLFSDGSVYEIAGYELSGSLEAGTSTITVSYREKTTTFNVSVTSRIPSAYRQVEYLQSDFSQAIQTAIAPRDTRTIVKFEFLELRSGGDNFVTGVLNPDNQRYYPCHVNSAGKLRFINRSNTVRWTYSGNIVGGVHTIDFNNSLHQALFDGEVEYTDSTFACTAGDWFIAIFARGRDTTETFSTNSSKARIWELEYIDNTSGDSVGNFIPCYRKSDNAGGFYDTVTGAFYGDVLSGNPFVFGAEHWEV